MPMKTRLRMACHRLDRSLPWLLLLFLAAAAHPVCSEGSERFEIFVSVLPQKYFVERVAGKHANVHVLVGPGQNPATYEPTPRQMAGIVEADLYFQIGVPFETIWLDRLRKMEPGLQIVDLRSGLPLRRLEDHSHAGASFPEQNRKDPHVWTNPRHVMTLVRTIRDALVGLDPENVDEYDRNLQRFTHDLDQLDSRIRKKLDGISNRRFLVFHPSWGYFADAYGLEQIAIEVDGKEPGPRTLIAVIEKARLQDIQVVFVQPQFDRRRADTVATALGAKLTVLDPLAEDYMDNMQKAAEILGEALR